ncbi:HAD family hydrolase [Granulicoccus sp. GXG6511]|uniref:HAD family hydrolase n=1 Tax=Granulicoccus sp. GXG6511 TaxID=3381351 RepID=UPI003D7DE4E5
MTRTAAFFDLDNTLLRGTSMIQLGRGLFERGFVSGRTMLRAALMEARFRATGSEHLDDTSDARDTALEMIKGRDVVEFGQHCAAIFDAHIAGRFCAEAVAVAQEHLDLNHAVWVVTASPVEIAELCAQHLGFTGGLGTVAERADGRYTGRLRDGLLHGATKAVAVRKLAETHGYDLARAHAYSDSSNDLPMLSLVGHPTAVNPDPHLRRHADIHDWPTLEFRDPGGVRSRVARGLKVGTSLRLAARALARRDN